MADQGQILNSWKEIAVYLNRTVRTCQRLETTMGLPIHRLDGSPKARVFAYPEELDAWISEKVREHEPPRNRKRLVLILLAAAAVLVAGGIITMITLGRGAAGRGRFADSIAVMPFIDHSTDKSLSEYASGLAEDVRVALTRIEGLGVRGGGSSAAAEGLGDSRKIGQRLKVDHLLSGSVWRTGAALRVSVELVRAETGFQVWANSYDEKKEGLWELGGEVAAAVAENLGLRGRAGQEPALLKRPTEDAEAYRRYLIGRNLLGQTNPAALTEALNWFRAAIERDPKFALPYAGIAWAHMNRITTRAFPPLEEGPPAEEAVKRALDLDPDLAEAHAANAWVQFIYRFDWEAAERSFRQALKLRPGDAMTRGIYAFFLTTRRRGEEARSEIRQALASDPFTPVLSAYYIWIHLYTKHYQELLDELTRLEKSGMPNEIVYSGAGQVYFIQGRLDESLAMYQKARALPSSFKRADAGLAAVYAKQGRRTEAEAIYQRLQAERKKGNFGVSAVYLAWDAVELGDIEGAYRWLNEAIAERDHNLASLDVQVECLLPRFAREPRFLETLNRLGPPR